MSTPSSNGTMTGGQALVECIRREGVRHVFNVPGESYLGALDAFFDVPEISVITNRQESGACLMAEAYGKATRSVGVCFVTRGPGATNASNGVHCATQDSTPLVLFVGQVPRVNRNREAFQEVDYHQFFGSIAKWVAEIDDPAKVPAITQRAFHVARSGRPGPVVISLPEDMLIESAEMRFGQPYQAGRPAPDPEQINALVERINRAGKASILVGSGVQYSGAREALVHFAETFKLPVATSFRRMDAFPNNHPHYAGNLGIGKSPGQNMVLESDLVLVVGDRLSEMTTNDYTLLNGETPVIQIDIDEAVIGRNFAPELGLVADAKAALEACLEHPGARSAPDRGAWISSLHAAQDAHWRAISSDSTPVSTESVMADLKAMLPEDAILTTDAGNFSGWIHHKYQYNAPESFLGPIVGTMGYGVPSAVAAKLAHPDRVVVGTTGDGGFMMTGNELATAVQYGANIIQLVFNNGMLGTIRMHQERDYPDRTIATDLINPDFAKLAEAYGAKGFTVKSGGEFRPALEAALAADKPCLVDIHVDREQISISATMADLRTGKVKSKRAR